MRGKDFNTGLRGVLFEARHHERMGSAVWLYGWLVLRQTHQTGSIGWVLGGAPITYAEIEEETGFNVRTLERWMRILRAHGYIETESVPGGIVVRITKAKKHAREAGNVARPGRSDSARNAAEGVRRFAGALRKIADRGTQNCVAGCCEVPENARDARRIGSSSLEETIDKSTARAHEPNGLGLQCERTSGSLAEGPEQKSNCYKPNPSCSGENQKQNHGPAASEVLRSSERPRMTRAQQSRPPWLSRDEVRLQFELLRAEREDAVRRELDVGRGPEPRPDRPKESAPAGAVGGSR